MNTFVHSTPGMYGIVTVAGEEGEVSAADITTTTTTTTATEEEQQQQQTTAIPAPLLE